MATTKSAAPKPAEPEVVKLKCPDLGVQSRDFTPAHAKALLDFQAAKGYAHWLPVDAPEPDAK